MREPGPPAVIWFEQKQTADSNCRSSLTKLQLTSVKHAFFIFVISFSCIFFTQMTRAVPPASCRIRVELFVENATPAGILWAIIMPPSNSGRSQIPRSLYISPRPLSLAHPLSPSLGFPPLHLSSWIALPTRCAVHPSPCPASALYFPVSSRQRILF